MFNYLFQIHSDYPIDVVKHELDKKGLKDIYIIEEDDSGVVFIGGRSRKKIRTDKAMLIEEKSSVDWENQWALFSQDFKKGKSHINLAPFGVEKTLLLEPGAGFGDLSHPTTNLMLEMMKDNVNQQIVVDIGTGSGILALVGIFLGARCGIGIDIDAQALKHAQKNAQLNRLETKIKFSKKLPKKLPSSVFLMNMILSEQKEFNPSRYNTSAKMWIVSGILQDQKGEYLKLAKSWGWFIIKEFQRADWMGWCFSVQK